ncbi:EscU/YscU/HrcU family type III secretion system export apparatus switch protein [Heliophilum fasciatum]|uniref:Flagellar biosynthesis protein n=1 Tax=Heliophilum fasciatum TaxID=35700 RepID=A0A4R2RMY6_9FIRM|nr:EscU/YscU/HrcU family type III secretion system export apparatus switch protein [Heliophilum fasciatum]MCW2278444.1 flagellar biosynthesis protein [Heliophilum fasciatum]TCP63657.1 flagellar biosynthesis protein [Heliophilum fasciatum]
MQQRSKVDVHDKLRQDLAKTEAVALRYDQKEEGAPKVVAKGQGYVARRILEVAEREEVPVVSDPALTKMLSALEIGMEIPEEFYPVVAEVLAFVYQLDRHAMEKNREILKQSEEKNRKA